MKSLKYILMAGLLASGLQAEMVKVTESTLITKPFTEKVKVGEQCYEDTVEVNVRCGSTDTNSIGVDTIVGTVIGLAIGNQIGNGSGKDVAKVVGGLGGAYTANSMRAGKTCKSYETVTRCEPKYEYRTVQKTIGYNNCAYVDGVKYCKQTKEPIEYLNIKKTITVY